MSGWVFRKTRKLHLITLLLTAISWFILGIWYGWDFCVCTEWHWQVREAMGYHDRSSSYIHFLILKLTGINVDEQLVNDITLIVFLVSIVLSVWLNLRDRKSKKSTGH